MESNPSWGARLQKAEAFKALPKSWPWSLQRSTLLSMPWRSSLPLMHCWPAVLQWALYPLMYRNSKEQETRSWRPAAGCTTFQKMTTCGGWSPSIICSSIWLLRLRPNKAAPTSDWCWADESLGGKLSKAAARRGGKHNPELISQHLMTRVSALQWCKPWRLISAASVVNSQKKGLVWGEKEELQEPAKRQMER